MQQKRKQKEIKEKEAAAKAQMYRYQGKPSEDAIATNRKEQHDREKGAKEKARETRSNLKDVLITDSIEGNIRKEQFNTNDKGWKEAQRQTRDGLKVCISF